MGVNQNEGSMLMIGFGLPEFLSKTQPNITYKTYTEYMSAMFNYYPKYPTVASTPTKNLITEKYANWANLNNVQANLNALGKAYGDATITCPVVDFANVYALAQQSVYFYQYVHYNQYTNLVPQWFGVSHASEIGFVFGIPLASETAGGFSYSEACLAQQMMDYWTNFATYGCGF
jgi:carboxylesterase type B